MPKKYLVSISLHIYLKDMYSGYFLAHLSQNCVYWVFPMTFLLKICILGIYFHIYTNGVSTGY